MRDGNVHPKSAIPRLRDDRGEDTGRASDRAGGVGRTSSRTRGKGSDAKETNRPRGPRTRTQPYPTTVEACPHTQATSRPLPLRVMGCPIHRSTFVSIGTDPSLLNPRHPRWTVPRSRGHVHPVPSYPFVPRSFGTFLPFCPRNPFPFDPGTSPGSAPS
eukprot:scaffold800_cov327-Pavlova_lutheri.AAC.13